MGRGRVPQAPAGLLDRAWRQLDVVEEIEHEVVNRHRTPRLVYFLRLFLATSAKENRLQNLTGLRTLGIKQRDSMSMILDDPTTTVATYLWARAAFVVYLEYERHNIEGYDRLVSNQSRSIDGYGSKKRISTIFCEAWYCTSVEVLTGDRLMTNHFSKLLLALTIVLVIPVSARDTYSIRRALVSRNYDLALSLTKQQFARVTSGGEAANLIQGIIAAAPANQIAPLVTTAVEANPQFGVEVINAAIQGASPSERSAILAGAYFALSQNPNASPTLVAYIDDLRSGGVPTYSVVTIPWFNPGSSVGHLGQAKGSR